MNAKDSHDTNCRGKYHKTKWEGQDIVKCNKCGFAPRLPENNMYYKTIRRRYDKGE